MDKCQPVQLKLKSNDKVYFLFIESENILNHGDSECYCYISSLPLQGGLMFFKSQNDALDDAMKNASSISDIKYIYPTLGFDEFYDDRDLLKYIVP